MNTETAREFFGWCTVINIGVMFLSLIKILSLRNWASRVHARMFGLADEDSVRQAYFQFFANYKIALVVFNFVPYLALTIMG